MRGWGGAQPLSGKRLPRGRSGRAGSRGSPDRHFLPCGGAGRWWELRGKITAPGRLGSFFCSSSDCFWACFDAWCAQKSGVPVWVFGESVSIRVDRRMEALRSPLIRAGHADAQLRSNGHRIWSGRRQNYGFRLISSFPAFQPSLLCTSTGSGIGISGWSRDGSNRFSRALVAGTVRHPGLQASSRPPLPPGQFPTVLDNGRSSVPRGLAGNAPFPLPPLSLFPFFLLFPFSARQVPRPELHPIGTAGCNEGFFQLRPYTPESTGSRLISEVKLVMAQSVLWWGTTREYCVL